MKQLVQGQLIALPTEKNTQRESCELSFIWGKMRTKMRTVAQEIASQIAWINCSKEMGGKGQCICDFGEAGNRCNQAHIFAEVFCQSC